MLTIITRQPVTYQKETIGNAILLYHCTPQKN